MEELVDMRKPNFFIVGAPKCGTSALNVYLDQHPEIFMAEEKECYHFATDLLPADDPFRSMHRYMELFGNARMEAMIGENSVLYLYSKAASEQIYKFDNRAKIIIQLRNPVDVLISYHSQLIFNGDESIEDLREALCAEEVRRRGQGVPAQVRFPNQFYYSELFAFSEQIERYLSLFGSQQIHIIVYDDFKADTAKCYRKTLEFLGVDPEFRPGFPVINANKMVRSKMLRRAINRPPGWLSATVKTILPRSQRRPLKRRIMRLNKHYAPRPPLDAEFRGQLVAKYSLEIERLGTLLDRDLTVWCKD